MISLTDIPAFDAESEDAFLAKRTRLACATAFLIGLLNPFSIRLVGLMPASEPVVLGLLGWVVLFVLLYGWSPFGVDAPRLFLLLLACQAIGLGGYVLSDLVRGSSSSDMLRGWSRMIFLGLDICALALLVHTSPKVLAALALGLVASVAEPILSGPLFGDWWKFGFAFPVTILLTLTGPFLFGWPGAALALLAAAAVHQSLDFRSLAALCLLASLFLGLRLFSRPLRRLLFAGGLAATLAFLPVAGRQILRSDQERASRSNAERSAMLQAAAEAFRASPFIGSGSWFSNTDVMTEFLLIRKSNAHLAGVGGFDDTDAEATAIHSQLLVSLAEGGIFGAAFFLAYGLVLLSAIYLLAVELPFRRLLPFMLFFLLAGFYNLLLSPFSGAHRMEIAMTVAIILKSFADFAARPGTPDAAAT